MGLSGPTNQPSNLSGHPVFQETLAQVPASASPCSTDELKRLLGPLVDPLLRDPCGSLDVSKIRGENFEEFKKFLSAQVKIDGISFNKKYSNTTYAVGAYLTSGLFLAQRLVPSYQRVLEKTEYEPLLRALWENRAGGEGQGFQPLLDRFTSDLIAVSAERFVSSHLSSQNGRQRLRHILGNPDRYKKEIRADLVKAIASVGDEQGYDHISSVRSEEHLSSWNYFNWGVTEEEVRKGAHFAENILRDADYYETRNLGDREKFLVRPEKIVTLPANVEGMGQKITSEQIRAAYLYHETQAKYPDPLSQMRAKLARFWLMAIDGETWSQKNHLGGLENRVWLIHQIESFWERSKGIQTEEEFLALNRELQDFLHGPLKGEGNEVWNWIKHKTVGYGLPDLFSEMTVTVKSPYTELSQFSDEISHAVDMGERIRIPSPGINPEQKGLSEAKSQFISGLEKTKLQLWYHYKQHKAVSRLGSNLADKPTLGGLLLAGLPGAFLGSFLPKGKYGDIAEIRSANTELDRMVERLEKAQTKEEVQREIDHLYGILKEDGVLHQAFEEAEMDGAEQLWGLAQTIGIILGTTLVTEGMGTAAALANATRTAAALKNGASALAMGRAAQAVPLTVRAAYGMKMGAWISLAENGVAVASGEVRPQEDNLLSWSKDSIATGLAMGLFTPLAVRLGHGVEKNILSRLFTRYIHSPIQGLGRFGGDTILEGAEELVDQSIRQNLDGKTRPLTWDQVREITLVSAAGGGTKIGAVAEGFGGRNIGHRTSDIEVKGNDGIPNDLYDVRSSNSDVRTWRPTLAQFALSPLAVLGILGAGGMEGSGKPPRPGLKEDTKTFAKNLIGELQEKLKGKFETMEDFWEYYVKLNSLFHLPQEIFEQDSYLDDQFTFLRAEWDSKVIPQLTISQVYEYLERMGRGDFQEGVNFIFSFDLLESIQHSHPDPLIRNLADAAVPDETKEFKKKFKEWGKEAKIEGEALRRAGPEPLFDNLQLALEKNRDEIYSIMRNLMWSFEAPEQEDIYLKLSTHQHPRVRQVFYEIERGLDYQQSEKILEGYWPQEAQRVSQDLQSGDSIRIYYAKNILRHFEKIFENAESERLSQEPSAILKKIKKLLGKKPGGENQNHASLLPLAAAGLGLQNFLGTQNLSRHSMIWDLTWGEILPYGAVAVLAYGAYRGLQWLHNHFGKAIQQGVKETLFNTTLLLMGGVPGEGNGEGSGKIQRTSEHQKAYEEALKLEERLGDSDWKVRKAAVEAFGSIIPHLEMKDRLPWALKIQERLEDSAEDVRYEAVSVLGHSIIPRLEAKDRLPFAFKVEERLGDLDEKVRNEASYVLGEFVISDLRTKDCLTFAFKLEERLSDQDKDIREDALYLLGTTMRNLGGMDRLPWALRLEELLGDLDGSIRKYAVFAFEGIIPHLEMKDRLPWALKIQERLEDSAEDVRYEAVIALKHWIIPELEAKDRLSFAFKVEERCGDSDKDVRRTAGDALKDITSHLDVKHRLPWALKIQKRLEDSDEDVREEATEAFHLVLSQLALPDRLWFLDQFVPEQGLKNISTPFLRLLRGISPEILSSYAERHRRPDLKILAAYFAAHLPWDDYFWQAYLGSSNKDHFLKKTAPQIEKYRRGKVLTWFDDNELHLAYAGLDSPEGLSYEDFLRRIKSDFPPQLFLQVSFTASVKELHSFHHRVDKGKVLQALEPMAVVKDADSFRAYYQDLFKRGNGALRNIKEDLKEVFPRGFGELKLEEILAGAKRLLPRIYSKGNNPPVQELIVRLALLLAWHREGIDSLKQRMEAIRGTKIPSDTVWEGLKATEEFYRDTLADVFKELGIEGEQIPSLRKQKRLLAAELERAKKEEHGKVEVEFIPSKSQADQFFGYVGEDCTKVQGDSIYREDFQIYRMIANHRLSGVLYLQKAKLDGKKALVLAIQPRSFWEVDQKALLKTIEENFGKIAEEMGYDAVLLMNNRGQQSNRQDMLKAIQERAYSAVEFKKGISGAVFEGNEFLAMWERGKEKIQEGDFSIQENHASLLPLAAVLPFLQPDSSAIGLATGLTALTLGLLGMAASKGVRREGKAIEELRSASEYFFTPIDAKGIARFKKDWKVIRRGPELIRMSFGYYANLLEPQILRGTDPYILLHNTGASPINLLKILLGKSTGLFPFTVADYYSMDPDYYHRALKQFAVERKAPNLTLKIILPASKLARWIVENQKSFPAYEGAQPTFTFAQLPAERMTSLFSLAKDFGRFRIFTIPNRGSNKDGVNVLHQKMLETGFSAESLVEVDGPFFEEVEESNYRQVQAAVKKWAEKIEEDDRQLKENLKNAWVEWLVQNFKGDPKNLHWGKLNRSMHSLAQKEAVFSPPAYEDFISIAQEATSTLRQSVDEDSGDSKNHAFTAPVAALGVSASPIFEGMDFSTLIQRWEVLVTGGLLTAGVAVGVREIYRWARRREMRKERADKAEQEIKKRKETSIPAILREFRSIDPFVRDAQEKMATTIRRMGELGVTEAIPDIRKVSREPFGDLDISCIQALRKLGREEEALELLLPVIVGKYSPTLKLLAAEILKEWGELPRSAEVAKSVLENQKASQEVHRKAAEILVELGEVETVLKYLDSRDRPGS